MRAVPTWFIFSIYDQNTVNKRIYFWSEAGERFSLSFGQSSEEKSAQTLMFLRPKLLSLSDTGLSTTVLTFLNSSNIKTPLSLCKEIVLLHGSTPTSQPLAIDGQRLDSSGNGVSTKLEPNQGLFSEWREENGHRSPPPKLKNQTKTEKPKEF